MSSPEPATIPEELLEEIFLRLPTLAALARTAAACTSFRRLIKSRAFRRRFGSLHRAPLLGFMDAAGFYPAEEPHPSAPLAGALAPCVEDFSFVPPVVDSASFDSSQIDDDELPRWRPCDGRILLDWVSLHPRGRSIMGDPEDDSDVSVLIDHNELADHHDAATLAKWKKRERCNAADFHLAVCDPLSRRYLLLPTIPEDCAARPHERLCEFLPMLVPTTADNENDDSLKVICIARYETKTALFVFLSQTRSCCKGEWSMATFPVLTPPVSWNCIDCVRGCFYWTQRWDWTNYLFVLDTRTMSFSRVDLLTGYHVQLRDFPNKGIESQRLSAVVVGREEAIEMFSLVGSCTLHHTSLQIDSHEWKSWRISFHCLANISTTPFPQWVLPRDSCSFEAL
ncbi:unnamed protein product [Alopecurus aequalis]